MAADASTRDWTGSTVGALIDFDEEGLSGLAKGATLATLATAGRVGFAAGAVLEAAGAAGADLTGAVFFAAVG
jgi:hypothetical protein